MADDRELESFRNRCRLFPLPDVVFFPHAILPLHIFEPRYRQMTEDALADGDRLITMVRQRDHDPDPALGAPVIEEIACLGRILQHQRLPDGRLDILLLGLKRVRLIRELATEKLYRLAEAEIVEDQEDASPVDSRRNDLHELFREVLIRTRTKDSDLGRLLEAALPLGPLTDLIAYTLGLPAAIKQRLLAEPRVGERAGSLMRILAELLPRDSQTAPYRIDYPPSFSAN